MPGDPFILFSFLNMKLRDEYASFEELCRDMDADPDEIIKKLASVGYQYDADRNCFH